MSPALSSSVSLYIHVPFCRERCTYCDFNTYAGLSELIPAYVEALCRELEDLQRLGLLAWDGSVARLTRRGRLLGYRVFVRFV